MSVLHDFFSGSTLFFIYKIADQHIQCFWSSCQFFKCPRTHPLLSDWPSSEARTFRYLFSQPVSSVSACSAPVSYTHLDVYKRQRLNRKLCVFHRDYEIQYSMTIDYVDRVLEANKDILEVYRVCAVSYTHLDVYKRQGTYTALLKAVGRCLSVLPVVDGIKKKMCIRDSF